MTKNDLPNLGIKPMPNIILGQVIEENKTEGGVFLPENAKGRNIPRVQLVAVGENITELKVGDIVHYAPFSQSTRILSIKGHKVMQIYPDEIVGVE